MTQPTPSRLRLPLWLAMGLFLVSVSRRMSEPPLPHSLEAFRRAPRPPAPRTGNPLRRVVRWRTRWLRLPFLRGRDSCYVRSLALFRFIDPADEELRIHFGVETTASGGVAGTPRGHAWVTLGGRVLEAPTPLAEGRVSELYAFPPSAAGGTAAAATTSGPGTALEPPAPPAR